MSSQKNNPLFLGGIFLPRMESNQKGGINNEIEFMEYHEHKFVIELIPSTPECLTSLDRE